MADTFFRDIKTKAPISRGYSLSKPFISEWVECIYGGSDEDRTRYLLHAMEALSQVSYGPITAPNYYTLKDFLGNIIFYVYYLGMEKSNKDVIQEICFNALIAATYAILIKRSKPFMRAIKANQNLDVKI